MTSVMSSPIRRSTFFGFGNNSVQVEDARDDLPAAEREQLSGHAAARSPASLIPSSITARVSSGGVISRKISL